MSALSRQDCYEYLQTHVFPPSIMRERTAMTDCWPGGVGLEVEMIPICAGHSPQHPPRVAHLYGEDCSLVAGINKLCKRYHWKRKYISAFSDAGEELSNQLLYRVFLDEQENISFEPGGQLEFASQPHCDMAGMVSRVTEIQELFDKSLADEKIALVQMGMNPWHHVDEVGLQMPQGRYQAMKQYFNRIDGAGAKMMRLSASIQINLDYGETDDIFLKRYLAAHLIAPFATALFANSPISESQLSELSSIRAHLWQHLDPARTGLIPALIKNVSSHLTTESCIEAYLNFALKAPVVFIEPLHYHVPEVPMTFGQWLEHPYVYRSQKIFPRLEDFITHLSLLFPEVRPRGFMEIRSIDCQSRHLQFIPMAFYIGLLYDPTSLDQTIDYLLPHSDHLTELHKKSVYALQDKDVAKTARHLMNLAIEGHTRLPSKYRGPELENTLRKFQIGYTEKKRSPADDARELWTKGVQGEDPGSRPFGLSFVQRLEESQREKLS